MPLYQAPLTHSVIPAASKIGMLLPLTHPTDILMALFFGEVRPPPYLNF